MSESEREERGREGARERERDFDLVEVPRFDRSVLEHVAVPKGRTGGIRGGIRGGVKG